MKLFDGIMTFSAPVDLEGGLYFFNGHRQTVAEKSTFPVYEPFSGKREKKYAAAHSTLFLFSPF